MRRKKRELNNSSTGWFRRKANKRSPTIDQWRAVVLPERQRFKCLKHILCSLVALVGLSRCDQERLLFGVGRTFMSCLQPILQPPQFACRLIDSRADLLLGFKRSM